MGFALFIIFIIAWLISPIVLLIVCLSQRSVIKQLRRENDTLRNETPAHGISAQGASPQNIPQPTPQPVTDYKDLYENPVQGDVQPVMSAETPQNVPENVPDVSAEIPQPVTAAPTQPVTPAAEKKNGVSTINIVLILGSLFVTLAGFIFAVAAWGVSNTFFKTVILVSFSAVFFGVSAFTERKLKLEATGKVFFTLGSVFLPAAIAAAGALELFGEYLSFNGEGNLLLLTIMSAILSLCFFIGANHYDSRHFAAVAYGALSFAAVFLILFSFPEKAPAALALSVYSIAALLLEPLVVKCFGENAVTRAYHSFARLNVWVLAVLSLFLSDGEPLFTAPAVIFSASMLISPYICKGEKHSPAGIYGFAVYLMLGTMLGIRPDSLGDLTMTASFVMIVYTCLVMMNVVPQEIRSILGKISSVMFCIIIAAGIIDVSGDFPAKEAVTSDLSVIISAAAVTLQTLIISLRNGSSVTKTGFYAAFVWAVLAAVGYFDKSFLIAAATSFLLFAVLKLIPAAKKLYAPPQDVIACTALLFFTVCADTWQISAAIWAMSLTAAFISGKNLVFGRIAAPVLTFTSFVPLLKYAGFLNSSDSTGTFVSGLDYAMMSSVVFCIIAAVTLLKPFRKYEKAFSLGIPLAFLSYFMQMIFGDNETAAMVIISAVTVYGALALISKYKNTGYISYSNFFLASLLIAAYQTGRFFLSGTQALIFPSVALMFMLGVYILPMLDGSRLSRCLGSFLLRALPVYGVIEFFVLEEYGAEVPMLVCAWLLIIGGAAVARMRKDSVLMFFALPIALIYTYSFLPTLAGNDYSQYIFAFIAAAVLGVTGRFLYMEKAFSKREWKPRTFFRFPQRYVRF